MPRENVVHAAACSCPDCGGPLKSIGEDVSEQLEFIPEHFKVIRHVRPKFGCAACSTIVQAAAPARPIDKGIAGPGLLAVPHSHTMIEPFTPFCAKWMCDMITGACRPA